VANGLLRVLVCLLGSILITTCGCGTGGSSRSSPPPSPQSFSISSARAQVTILPNSTELINLALTANTGFSGTVNVTLSGLPYGVTAAPASAFTLPASGLFWPHGHTGG
jgi:hypothetical protein